METVAVLVLIVVCALFAYQCGVMDGERREYKKWFKRQWHRPGCPCDAAKDES